MTTKDAIKHLSDKIDYAEQCDDKWVDSVSIKALYIAVRAMAEERKKGKWIVPQHDLVISATCSCCGWNAILFETDVAGMPYCPNCGADMREEKTDVE